jgi:hypothetical protein
MKPLSFIIGLLLIIYVAAGAIGGTLQYSFEGYIGSGAYYIASRFTAMPLTETVFLGIIYAVTIMFGIVLMMNGVFGQKRRKK